MIRRISGRHAKAPSGFEGGGVLLIAEATSSCRPARRRFPKARRAGDLIDRAGFADAGPDTRRNRLDRFRGP